MNKDLKNYGTGYYDFGAELLSGSCGSVDEVLYVRDLQRRKFYYNCDIEQDSVVDIVRHIMQINREDSGIPAEERPPIYIYLSSNGGDVDAGFELIDIIENSITPVYLVNLSWCYSMGFLIYLAGHKRFATQNAKFLMHDGSSLVFNSTSKARDLMEFNEKTESRIKDYVLRKTRISEDDYERKRRDEWYMYADVAKELGVVDYIVGEDVAIDEVI